VTGVGTDAAPYFRVFTRLQGEKFDPERVRSPVGARAERRANSTFMPMDDAGRSAAGRGTRSQGLPAPIVDHALARERTLAAYKMADMRGHRQHPFTRPRAGANMGCAHH